MSNNTISTNLSISTNSTDQMMDSLSLKQGETLHISDLEKNNHINHKPVKRAKCRLFCCGFFFGLISSILILAVTLYVFDYMGTIVLEMPYSPWRQHQHSSSSNNRTGAFSHSLPYSEGSSLTYDNSGHQHSHHQQQNYDPISRSYVLPDRFNATANSLSNNSISYHNNSSIQLIQSNDSKPGSQETSGNSGDSLVNSGNDIELASGYNETLRADSNDGEATAIVEGATSFNHSNSYEPIPQFDDSVDPTYNQAQRDGKTIDLSHRSTPLPFNITSPPASQFNGSPMISETADFPRNNLASLPVVTSTPNNPEIKMVTKEILNYTHYSPNHRINGGSVGKRVSTLPTLPTSLSSASIPPSSLSQSFTPADEQSLPPMQGGFIENPENVTFNDSTDRQVNQSTVFPTIIAESPISGRVIDLTNGQSFLTNLTESPDNNNNQTLSKPEPNQGSSNISTEPVILRPNDENSTTAILNTSIPIIEVSQSTNLSILTTTKLIPTKIPTQPDEPLTVKLSPSITTTITATTTTPTNVESEKMSTSITSSTTFSSSESYTSTTGLQSANSERNNTNHQTNENGMERNNPSQLNGTINGSQTDSLSTQPILLTNHSSTSTFTQLSPSVLTTTKEEIISTTVTQMGTNAPQHSMERVNLTLTTTNEDENQFNQSTINQVERSINENFTLNGTMINMDQLINMSNSSIKPSPIDESNFMLDNNNTNPMDHLSPLNSTLNQGTNSSYVSKGTELDIMNGTRSNMNATIGSDGMVGNFYESSNGTIEGISINGTLPNTVSKLSDPSVGTTQSPLECNSKQIKCSTVTGKEACLPIDVVCDGVRDCTDGSDESDCQNSCGTNYKCGNESSVTCISRKYHCDGLWDCDDGSDESTCYFTSCMNELSCADKSSCLLPIQVCDGKYDCRDHSDEQECDDHSSCLSVGKFFCDNMCIEYSLRCDGSKDCLDGTDESNCTCTGEEFKCWNGDCIDRTLVCDGQSNCRDSSDEWSCVKTDENDVVSMINPLTGNWALLCADESTLAESDHSLLCQKMGLERAVNYSTAIIKTIGEVEWVAYNQSSVSSLTTCNPSSILMLECQTFKCSMMATPVDPSASSPPPPPPAPPSPSSSTSTPTVIISSSPTLLSTSAPVSHPSTLISPIDSNSTITNLSPSSSPAPIIPSSPPPSINSPTALDPSSSTLPSSSTSTTNKQTSPAIMFSSSTPSSTVTPASSASSSTPLTTTTTQSPSSTIEASLLAIPAMNYNVPLSRPTRATSPNEIQSMVTVMANETEPTSKNQCLAQIIAPMWLLSSAECLRQLNDLPLIVKGGTGRIDGAVNQVITHPHTSKFRYLHIRDFDLALISLKEPLPLSSSLMSSICLPESDVASDITCFMPVIGETEARPYLIQDRSTCNERKHFNSSLTQRQICASPSDESPNYVPNPGSNLVCLSSSTEWFIGGFVSFASPRTSYTKHPSVFSNVFAMKDFINQVVAVNLYRSKMESPFNYTFDLTSSSLSNETIPYSGSTSTAPDEMNKSDNSTIHDNLLKTLSNDTTNNNLNNQTDSSTSNQPISTTDPKKPGDRSRSLDLDFDINNSTLFTTNGTNQNQLINETSTQLTTDSVIYSNDTNIDLHEDGSNKTNNPLRDETIFSGEKHDITQNNTHSPDNRGDGKSIELKINHHNNTHIMMVNQTGTVVNEMNTTIETLTTIQPQPSIPVEDVTSSSYSTTLSSMPSSPPTSLISTISPSQSSTQSISPSSSPSSLTSSSSLTPSSSSTTTTTIKPTSIHLATTPLLNSTADETSKTPIRTTSKSPTVLAFNNNTNIDLTNPITNQPN